MGYRTYAVSLGNNGDVNDATGAFIPGAQKFSRAFGGSYKLFINAPGKTKRNFMEAVAAAPENLDIFAYFGHGYKTQLESAKIYTKADIEQLAELLKRKLKPSSTVVLYACWAGIETGFSTMLQNLLGSDVWVYGHATKGHSYANPDLTEVQRTRNPGYRRLFPNGHELRAAWSEALLYTDMWIRFPLMWDSFIIKELQAIRMLGRWKTANGNYLFSWNKLDGVYNSLSDINKIPVGSVVNETSGEKGTWSLDDTMSVKWDSGGVESWQLPINPKGQNTGNGSVKAVRVSHTLPGKRQG